MPMRILLECCPLCRLHRALHSGRGENYLTEHGKSCKIVYVEICAVNIKELRGYPAPEALHSLRAGCLSDCITPKKGSYI